MSIGVLCIIFAEPEVRGYAAEKSQLYHVMSYLVKKLAAWTLVEEIYLSYSEENNQVSYNSDPNPMPRYGGKPSECIGKCKWV